MSKFYKAFKRKTKKCNRVCKHYYERIRYRDGRLQYGLKCTIHGYLITVPNETAIETIADGAPWNDKGEKSPFELEKR